jgi:hypothetical protein
MNRQISTAFLGLVLVGCGAAEMDMPAGTGGQGGGGTGGIGPTPQVEVDAGASPDSAPRTNVDRFVGIWKYASGAVTRICAGQTETFSVAGHDEQLARGVDGEGLVLIGGCAIKLTVVADTAIAPAGSTCTEVGNDGSSTTLNYTSLALTTTDGRNMTVAGAGNLTFLGSGQSIACTFSIAGSLMKYAN